MFGIEGLHHVTAIAGQPQVNIDFYAGVLGLRLVKVTVNFDDPTTYHLYYGDGQGHPGTILTFFPWRGAPKGRIGTGQLTVTSLCCTRKIAAALAAAARQAWDRIRRCKVGFRRRNAVPPRS